MVWRKSPGLIKPSIKNDMRITSEFKGAKFQKCHIFILPCLKSSCSGQFCFSSLYFCCRNSIRGHSHILRLLARITASFLRGSCKEKQNLRFFFYKIDNTLTSIQTVYYSMFMCLGKEFFGPDSLKRSR
jgi:hypothetical protein